MNQNLQTVNPCPITSTPWEIKLLYDGECPLCLREVNFLQKRDAGRGLIAFVDISNLNYNPEDHNNISFEAAMGRIHALLPDGTILQNVEVFYRVYQVLGLGWIYAPTRWPLIGSIINAVYEIWADWRLAFTGRPNLATLIQQRQQALTSQTPTECRCQPELSKK